MDDEGRYIAACVGLHTSAQGPLAHHRFRVCPVWACNPDAHPWISTALRAYARWKRFGVAPSGEKLLEAVEVLDQEFTALERHKWEREHPST